MRATASRASRQVAAGDLVALNGRGLVGQQQCVTGSFVGDFDVVALRNRDRHQLGDGLVERALAAVAERHPVPDGVVAGGQFQDEAGGQVVGVRGVGRLDAEGRARLPRAHRRHLDGLDLDGCTGAAQDAGQPAAGDIRGIAGNRGRGAHGVGCLLSVRCLSTNRDSHPVEQAGRQAREKPCHAGLTGCDQEGLVAFDRPQRIGGQLVRAIERLTALAHLIELAAVEIAEPALVQDRGVHRGRADRQHADPVADRLGAQRQRQPDDRVLGHHIAGDPARGRQARHRGGVDDVAAAAGEPCAGRRRAPRARHRGCSRR